MAKRSLTGSTILIPGTSSFLSSFGAYHLYSLSTIASYMSVIRALIILTYLSTPSCVILHEMSVGGWSLEDADCGLVR